MKKIIISLIFAFTINFLPAQGTPPYMIEHTMYIYNYTKYALYHGQVSTRNEANGCWPSATGHLASWVMPIDDPSGLWWTELRKFSGYTNIPLNNCLYFPNSSVTTGLTILPYVTGGSLAPVAGTSTGWGGYLAEYGDVDGAVLGYIAVGYHYNEVASTPCYTYPWVHTDAFMTATSFYIGNDYYLVVT